MKRDYEHNAYYAEMKLKGIKLPELIRRAGLNASMAQVSRTLKKASKDRNNLTKREEEIVNKTEEFLAGVAEPAAIEKRRMTVRAAEIGLKMNELHEIYCERTGSGILYKNWLAAVNYPYTAGEYRTVRETERVLREIIAERKENDNAQP